MSAYCQQKRAQNTIRPTATNSRRRNIMEIQSQRNACRGCGSFQHGKTGSGDRPRMCPAWGQTCRACGKENHIEGVCQSKGRVKQGAVWSPEDEEAVMDALIAHMVFDPATNTYKPGNHISREEVEATLIPFSPCPDPRRAEDIPSFRPTKLRIYPDSGATICLGGIKHLRTHGNIREELGPLKQEGAHGWRILLDMPRAGYPSPSKWEKRPQNRHCTYAEMYRYCTSAKMHAWMWVYCPLAFLSP